MKNELTAGAALLLAACAQPPIAAPVVAQETPRPAVAVVLPEQVGKCQYLDDVASVSSRYGIFASAALDDTRAQVLEKAAAAGATHLVWEAPILAHGSTTSRGKAYRCS